MITELYFSIVRYISNRYRAFGPYSSKYIIVIYKSQEEKKENNNTRCYHMCQQLVLILYLLIINKLHALACRIGFTCVSMYLLSLSLNQAMWHRPVNDGMGIHMTYSSTLYMYVHT